MKTLQIVIFTLILSLAMCWGDIAHMVIAQIAKTELEAKSPVKYSRAENLSLALNYLSDNKSQDFIQSSAWADDISSQGFFFWDTWHGIQRPVVPDGMEFTSDAYVQTYNVVTGIEYCRQALLNDTNLTLSENAMMLRLAINLIGDVHQPLHNAQLFNSTFPNGDNYGNLEFLQTLQSKNISLHEYWDRGAYLFDPLLPIAWRPLNSTMKTYIQNFSKNLTDTYSRTYFGKLLTDDLTPDSWSIEGYTIASSTIYPSIKNTNYIQEDLQFQFQRIAAERTTLAGYRLADWLYQNIYNFGS